MILGLALIAVLQAAPKDSTFQLRIPMTEAPVIDGVLDGTEWDGAARATDFIQYEPRRGEPSSERTEAFIMQDETHVYVAFRVWDSREPTALVTRRDSDLFSDDAVFVLIDTYHDRQSAYLFGTNMLGAQSDSRIASDGNSLDNAWDAAWETGAGRFDGGWVAEIAIPLSEIRYDPGDSQTWGINFGRSIRRSLEVAFWAGPLDQRLRVSQAGTLGGLSLPTPPRPLDLIVYGLTHVAEGESADWDAGADVRFNPFPTVTLNGTVNPDFATIEADREEVNLSRFEISLPEKRPFFLEGNELFGQRLRTFYSRRISDIRGGGKVLGRAGQWTYEVLAVGAEAALDESAAAFGVTRVQRNLGRSSVGMTWAERRVDSTGQGSVGVDANLFFSPRWGFTGQFVQSYGEFKDGTEAFFLRPAYDSPTGHAHVRYQQLGNRFGDNINAIGFVRDDDRREIDVATEKSVWFDSGGFERVQYEANYNIYWGTDGTRRSWAIDQGVDLTFRNRWSLDLAHTEEFKLFEKDFRNRATSVDLGYDTRESMEANIEVEFGRSFDSDFVLVGGGADIKPTATSSLGYDLEWLTLDPDPEGEGTWIHGIRGSQFFTNDLFIQFFFQTNSVIDRREAQATFVYRYKPPFGTIQLSFERGRADFGERSEQGNTVFLKATWVF